MIVFNLLFTHKIYVGRYLHLLNIARWNSSNLTFSMEYLDMRPCFSVMCHTIRLANWTSLRIPNRNMKARNRKLLAIELFFSLPFFLLLSHPHVKCGWFPVFWKFIPRTCANENTVFFIALLKFSVKYYPVGTIKKVDYQFPIVTYHDFYTGCPKPPSN